MKNLKDLFGVALAIGISTSSAFAAAEKPGNREQLHALLQRANQAACHTMTGQPPLVTPMSADGLYHTFHTRFGIAKYSEDNGFQIFLDAQELPKASVLLQDFIIAHECAHQELGHTYEEYDKGFMSWSQQMVKEREADCFALRRVYHDHGVQGAAMISGLFEEFNDVKTKIISRITFEDASERQALLDNMLSATAEREAAAQHCPIY